MKRLKRAGIAAVALPVILIAGWMSYEIFGMCVNHMTTREQSDALQADLESEISDLEIIDVHSETGNTSGTGNHVECLSRIAFSTELGEDEIENRMSKHYAFDGVDCYVDQTDDGHFTICVKTSAPFADNIEGH